MEDEKQELTLNDLLEAINDIKAKIDVLTPKQEEKADETDPDPEPEPETEPEPTPAPQPEPETETETETEETEEESEVGDEEEIDKILKDC